MSWSYEVELASRCDVALARSDYERALPIVGGEIGPVGARRVRQDQSGLGQPAAAYARGPSSVSLVRALALESLVDERFERAPSFLKPFLADRSEMVRAVAIRKA